MSLFDIAVVNFNTRDLLKACLKTIFHEAPNKVIVVDNGSTDDSSKMVEVEFPTAIICENRINSGYSFAANQAFGFSNAKYVLLLNSDTMLCAGVLKKLGDYLEQNPKVAIAGPRLLSPDGKLQHSCFPFPTLLDVFLDVSNFNRLIKVVPYLRNRYLRTWSHDRPRSVPCVLGAAMAVRRRAFDEVGGFDESFFMYYEEVDLCYRLKECGWEIHFTPAASVIHVGGASTQQRPVEMIVQFHSSLTHFYRLHYSIGNIILLVILMKIAAIMRLARDKILFHMIRDPRRRIILKNNIASWKKLISTQWYKE